MALWFAVATINLTISIISMLSDNIPILVRLLFYWAVEIGLSYYGYGAIREKVGVWAAVPASILIFFISVKVGGLLMRIDPILWPYLQEQDLMKSLRSNLHEAKDKRVENSDISLEEK